MKVTLDAQMLFDEQELEISAGSFSRDSIERTVPGLDGVLSIDLGRRSRKITQTGTLRAKSRAQLDERISRIAVFMDGDTHTLTTGISQISAWIRSRQVQKTPAAPASSPITKSFTHN